MRRDEFKGEKNYSGWIRYFVIGTELAFSVVAGLVLGQYADKWLKTETPWFTILGLIAGVVAGFGLLIMMTKGINGNRNNETGKNTD